MRDNRGITIVSLIITIVVIIILSTVTIYYGLGNNVDKAEETKVVNEVTDILEAVASRTLLNKLNPSYYVFIGETSYEPIEIKDDDETTKYSSDDGWYLVNKREHFNELGLDEMKGSFLVNYEDTKVVSVEGISYKGTKYYSLNEMKQLFGGGNVILASGKYDPEKGVNAPVLSKGMVPVKYSIDHWVITTTDDDEWYDYSASQKAWANIMLMDELMVEGYATNEQVRNANMAELVGKTVTKEGSGYVWIPRYTIQEGTNKVIFSNLTDDVTMHEGESYTTLDAFKYESSVGTVELTGIWVSKYEAGFRY